jgi:hypothetical protein
MKEMIDQVIKKYEVCNINDKKKQGGDEFVVTILTTLKSTAHLRKRKEKFEEGQFRQQRGIYGERCNSKSLRRGLILGEKRGGRLAERRHCDLKRLEIGEALRLEGEVT